MTTAADDSAVEDAFEALLAGRPVPEGAAGLAAFTEAVRTSATRPGRPNAALAELLATGLLTDQSSPSVRTATSAGSASQRRPSRVRTRRRPAMIVTALIAKFLSAGAVAQAATGATVAVVAFTGVGAVGALPDPVQDTFATVVSEITPLQPPTSDEPTEELPPEEPVADEVGTTEEITADVAVTPDVEAAFSAWALEGPGEGEAFSAWVGEGSKEDLKVWLDERGFTFGDVVSRWASGKEFSAEELEALAVKADKRIAAPVEPDADVVVVDEPETESAAVAVTEDKGSRGKGNSNAGDAAGGKGDKGKGNGKN